MNDLEMSDIFCLAAAFSKRRKALNKCVDEIEGARAKILKSATPQLTDLFEKTKAAEQDLR
ncbi:hypothetical protein, partial [uncultured Kiloniella sp.]|uniref:hypothetical protein n=1 Tax=uncultured Kiloniella sp. TaxID=1133091 RepID=UPI0026351D05